MAKSKNSRTEPKKSSAKSSKMSLASAKNSDTAQPGSRRGGLSRRGRFIIRCNPPRYPARDLGKPVLLINERGKGRMIHEK